MGGTPPRPRRSGGRHGTAGGAFLKEGGALRRRSVRGVWLHLAALVRGGPLTPALSRKGRGGWTALDGRGGRD